MIVYLLSSPTKYLLLFRWNLFLCRNICCSLWPRFFLLSAYIPHSPFFHWIFLSSLSWCTIFSGCSLFVCKYFVMTPSKVLLLWFKAFFSFFFFKWDLQRHALRISFHNFLARGWLACQELSQDALCVSQRFLPWLFLHKNPGYCFFKLVTGFQYCLWFICFLLRENISTFFLIEEFSFSWQEKYSPRVYYQQY